MLLDTDPDPGMSKCIQGDPVTSFGARLNGIDLVFSLQPYLDELNGY